MKTSKRVAFGLIALLLVVWQVGFGQVTIAKQSFEASGDTWNVAISPAAYNSEDPINDNGPVDGNEDVWDNIAAFTGDIDLPTDGTLFWGMQDLDNTGGGGNFEHTLSFSQDITNYSSVSITFDYNVIGFDGGDDLYYELTYDGTAQGNVFLVTGANGGGVSTAGWVTETINVPDAVDQVELVLKALQNGPDFAAWDNVVISGTLVMPVVVSAFWGENYDNKTNLTWQTATEQNNSHFLIQRSADGRVFENIGRVEGAGDSDQSIDYSFVDDKPKTGINYYRLHQFDFDGTNEVFGPIAVRFGADGGKPRLWPVPATDRLQVDLPTTDLSWNLEVFSADGQLLRQQKVEDKNTQAFFDVSALPAGVYFMRWANGHEMGQQRFVKQ